MQRQIVGGRAHFIERDQLDAETGRHFRRDEGIVRDDAHAERAGAVRDFLADSAQPRDAERLAAELGAEKALLLPAFFLHGAVGGGNRAGERKHQRQRMLGDADAVGAGRVDDDDAALGGRRDVDVVHAGARARDDTEPWGGGEQARVHLGGAAHQQRVRVSQVRRERVGLASRARVDLPAGLSADQFQRGGWQVVGYYDFQRGPVLGPRLRT